MELKDVILSTLAELEEGSSIQLPVEDKLSTPNVSEIPLPEFTMESITAAAVEVVKQEVQQPQGSHDDEIRMLEGIRERLLVLFEGFQSPNNAQIEAKVDLTLNFLEYLLASIENRLDSIK